MQEKTAEQYLQEAWNAVERRSKNELRSVKTEVATLVNTYASRVDYLEKNLEFLKIAGSFMEKETASTESELIDAQKAHKNFVELYNILFEWQNKLQ